MRERAPHIEHPFSRAFANGDRYFCALAWTRRHNKTSTTGAPLFGAWLSLFIMECKLHDTIIIVAGHDRVSLVCVIVRERKQRAMRE